MGNPPQSDGTSPAIRAHTALHATWRSEHTLP